MTAATEQYRYWLEAGLSHGEMIEALGLVPPDHPTRGDAIAALEYAGWRLASEIEMEGSDARMTQVSRLVAHRVWELIVPAARTGRPPPSISAMARMLRRSGHTIRAALATLEDRGMIRRETVSGIGQRIYVVSLGQWTGWTGSRVRESARPMEDPDAYLAAAMRGRRYVDLPGYERVGAGGRAPARPAAYSPSTSSAAWAA